MSGADTESALHLSKDSSADTISEQKQFYDDICEMLVTAGYFRARISTLPPFDKILGGLTWCITAGASAIDIDLFFDEDMTLGNKIKLGENVVTALGRMRCPSPLQTHQIRGLDFKAMFPIFQWLVKLVLLTRQERGEQIRKFCALQYSLRSFTPTPQDADDAAFATKAVPCLKKIADDFKPMRQLKRIDSRELPPKAYVDSVLLEFGRGTALSKADEEAARELKSAGGGRRSSVAGRDGEDGVSAEENAVLEAMKRMGKLAKDAADGISGSKVNAFVGMHSDELAAAAAAYEEAIKAAGLDAVAVADQTKTSSLAAHKRQLTALNKKQKSAESLLAGKLEELNSLAEEASMLEQQLNKKLAQSEKVMAELAKLAELETPENKDDLQMLLQLLMKIVMMNEALKQQEADMKANCKRQKADLEALLARLKDCPLPADEMQRMLQIEQVYEQELSRLKQLKQLLSKKAQEIQLLRRKIDDVPTRTELVQYERRFVELYEQVAGTTDETKKYYTTYNTLQNTKDFILKESKVMDRKDPTGPRIRLFLLIFHAPISVCENFPKNSDKRQFVESMEGILKGVGDTLGKFESRVAASKASCDEYNIRLVKATQKQRDYFKTVKEFQDECTRNEKLQAEAQERGLVSQ